jgi:hypothetical protein
MQFRPVGVEGAGEELTPEAANFGEQAGPSVVAGRRGGKGSRSDRCHNADLLFAGGFRRVRGAFSGGKGDIWPDLLKQGFNCSDPSHTWCRPRNDPW